MKTEVLANPAEHRKGVFATTNWSVVVDCAAADSAARQQALELLCRTYWKPVYAYARRFAGTPEAAQDLAQEFFARVLEKDLFARAAQDKGRFRTFLLTLLKRFLADQHDHATAQKRGGANSIISMEEMIAEKLPELTSRDISPDEEFDRRWALSALDQAMARLRAEASKSAMLKLFDALQPFLSGGDSEGSLAQIAAKHRLGQSAVKMRLHRWRQRFRELLFDVILQTVPRTADVQEEMQHLFKTLVR